MMDMRLEGEGGIKDPQAFLWGRGDSRSINGESGLMIVEDCGGVQFCHLILRGFGGIRC